MTEYATCPAPGAGPSGVVAAESFRASMSKLTAGVVLVTAMIDDQPWGVTLSSVSSFSAEPARISLSVTRQSALGRHLTGQNAVFGVAILPDELAHLAERLAAPGKPKFIPDSHLSREWVSPAPSISGAIYNLGCRTSHVVRALDHLMVIADVLEATAGPEQTSARPLTYFDRSFGSFTPSTTQGDEQ